MVSLNCRKSIRSKRSSGMTLVEITVTLAMVALAAGAVTKLAAMQSILNRQHEMRLVATLQSQNAAERLRSVAYDEFPGAVSELAKGSVYEGLRFDLSPFETDDVSGLHLQIDAVDPNDSTRVLASEHLWRIQGAEGVSNASE